MVMNWENFFERDGGASQNSFQFGMSSIFVDVGMSVGIHHLNKPILKEGLFDIKQNLNSSLKNFNQLKADALNNKSSLYKHNGTTLLRNRYKELKDLRTTYKMPAKKLAAEQSAKLTKNIGKLNRLARGVGWSYLALGFASMAESIVTPGLTKSATSEQQQMGMTTPMDGQGAYTQRQRALMAIHESQLGLRNVIGSEAGYMHK